jgi:hypothetical protein
MFGIRLIKCRFAVIKINTLKIEQVLVHYLLKNKFLTLQGIGTLRLDAAVPDSADPEKPIIIPADAITFHYDPKVTEDDQLVDFIVIHTKKIKPLASSDLDSFLSLGRQFLNIGKPFNLQNIGTLEKLNSGELVFIGGQLVAPRMEPQKAKIEDEGAEEHEENMFNDYQKERKSGSGKQTIFVILALLILGLIAWGIWQYNSNKPDENISTTDAVVPVTDSARIKDSMSIYAPADSIKINNPSDSNSFKVVVNEYTTLQAASKRLETLKKYNRNVVMFTNDSVTYKIAEPFTRPLSDTTKIMDSLNRYYGKNKTHIEL